MPHLFRLANPNIGAISVGGRTHTVNPDGLLEVEPADLSPHLLREITGHFGGQEHKPDEAGAGAAVAQEEDERQILFAQLDIIYGHAIDRRRSLKQLRVMMEQHKARQARTEGANTTVLSDKSPETLAHAGAHPEPTPSDA